MQKLVGTPALQSYLEDALRPKQLEEYYAAFEGGVWGAAAVQAAAFGSAPGYIYIYIFVFYYIFYCLLCML